MSFNYFLLVFLEVVFFGAFLLVVFLFVLLVLLTEAVVLVPFLFFKYLDITEVFFFNMH